MSQRDSSALKLDLARFRQPVSQVSRRFDPAALGSGEADAYVVAEPVVLEFDLHKDKRRFRVVGRAQTELVLPCSRCLEPYRLPIDVPLDLRYSPESERDTEATQPEQDVSTHDADTSYYADDTLDLGELLREQFYLALPMKALCRDGCLGLCPECGANRNVAPCTCNPQWVDPRLEALKGFVERTEKP